MFSRSFIKKYHGISGESVWCAWSDVGNWPKWDNELDYCNIDGPFDNGTSFVLKPKGGPKVTITLYDVMPIQSFSDYCRFPGAIMHDIHEIIACDDGVEIKNTIYMNGPLTFLWWLIVGRNVSKSIEKQTDNLVSYARTNSV